MSVDNINPKVLGCDVYHGDSPIEFHSLANAGYQFVFCKASQGAFGLDPDYADFVTRARSTGLVVGSYHYFTQDDPVQQAQHYLNAANVLPGDLVPCLDIETPFPGMVDAVNAATAEIKRITGRYPIWYMNRAFWEQYWPNVSIPGPLWLAEYGVAMPAVACDFWQYTESGTVDGHTGALDCDVFYGTIDDLRTHCI